MATNSTAADRQTASPVQSRLLEAAARINPPPCRRRRPPVAVALHRGQPVCQSVSLSVSSSTKPQIPPKSLPTVNNHAHSDDNGQKMPLAK